MALNVSALFNPKGIQEVIFQAKGVAALVPALVNSGIIGAHGAKATAVLPANLARYRLTTARELEQGYATCPERVALIDDTGAITYRQLRNNARTLAKHLLSLGLDEIRLGIMARNGRGIVTPTAAKGYAGASIYLLNVSSSKEQLAGSIKECGINVLIIDDEFADRMPTDILSDTPVIIGFDTASEGTGTEPYEVAEHNYPLMKDIVAHPERLKDVKLPMFPRHGMIVLMSSGTTGIPKGIMRNEPVFPVVVATLMGTIPWRADQKVQVTASMFHTWGWAAINLALGARNTVVTHRIFNPESVLDDIERYKLEGMVSSPVFYKQMIQADPEKKYDTSTLEFIASAGNAVSPQLVKDVHGRFGPILCNAYGSTELALASAATAEQVTKDPTTAGKIASGTKLRIIGKDGLEKPRGEIGEVFLTNETALIGYTNPDKKVNKKEGLVSIGDLGFIDEDNHLHIVGRADDMIIVGGENVHPQSVIEILEEMSGIKDVHAQGVEDDLTFARIAVWVVRRDDEAGHSLNDDSIREFVRENLADHSVPRDVHFIDELPRNPTGKVVPRLL
ncbi:AMP-binding protein [Corynebacterium casei]|uniref:AMP-binding protein n=1 Tax=Corynebacterium casei TaxID=160386 RepID=UPI00264817F7|nr:AMP-binding protein [Corynebacterium casei]MDN6341329.1 AMP-binding protein [Corynebacterium casei]